MLLVGNVLLAEVVDEHGLGFAPIAQLRKKGAANVVFLTSDAARLYPVQIDTYPDDDSCAPSHLGVYHGGATTVRVSRSDHT